MSTGSHHVYDDHRQIPFRYVYYIDKGGQGVVDTVERASEPPEGKLYARKHFVLSKTPTPMELDMVLQEINIAKSLQHDHIVRLVETYQYKNTYAIIMDPVAEANLGLYLSNLDDTPEDKDDGHREQLSRWFGCLANVIAFLHEKKIHHRDIKPQNILILKGNILLTDFGISREFQEKTNSGPTETLGTKTYRSLELESGRRPGRREDIFSLGAVFLEMLTVYSGHGQLKRFRDFRGGPYCLNIDKVREWMDSLSKRHYNVPWYLTMLFLCRVMLEIKRESRPYADNLARCWEYQPFLAVPPTSCNCIAPSADRERRKDGTLDEALQRAAGSGDWLPIRLLIEKGADVKAKGVHGLTALQLATENGHKSARPSSHSDALGEGAHLDEPDSAGSGNIRPDMVQRKVKAALNKITSKNFDKIAGQILEIAAQSKDETDGRTLRQVTQLTFKKACDEQHRSSMYAKLCKEILTSIAGDIKDNNIHDKHGNPVAGANLFRKYLLNRCQEEFERGCEANLLQLKEGEGEAAVLSDESAAAKRRWLGLIQFLGELYKQGMLTLRIIHECVLKLVSFEGLPDESAIESLVKLLQTVGAKMETTESGPKMIAMYFECIEKIMYMEGLPSRLKFMLRDTIDLRKAGWTGDAIRQRGRDPSPLLAS